MTILFIKQLKMQEVFIQHIVDCHWWGGIPYLVETEIFTYTSHEKPYFALS